MCQNQPAGRLLYRGLRLAPDMQAKSIFAECQEVYVQTPIAMRMTTQHPPSLFQAVADSKLSSAPLAVALTS